MPRLPLLRCRGAQARGWCYRTERSCASSGVHRSLPPAPAPLAFSSLAPPTLTPPPPASLHLQRNIELKQFRGIPIADLELVMPEKKVFVPPKVFVEMAVTLIGGLVAMMAGGGREGVAICSVEACRTAVHRGAGG